MPKQTTTDETPLTPEQRLAPENLDLLRACIVTIPDIDVVQECVAYENAHQNREPVLRWLAEQADEVRDI